MTEWFPTTYFPDLTAIDEHTVTFAREGEPGESFSLTIPRKEWERMGLPGRVTFEPRSVILTALEESARLSTDTRPEEKP